MNNRRQVLVGSASLLLFSALESRGGDASRPPNGTSETLVALPGKKRLIKRSFRPPNFETPLAQLQKPFTSNDQFFVRYHIADIPEVDPRNWRLKVGGASAQRDLELSLDDLKRNYERVNLAAVNQCSGNRRGLFAPRAGGIQWHYGAMGNAMWGGVRLRDVLSRAGIRADALEVVFDGADRGVLPATPDFIKSLPIDRALDESTLIAFEMNGSAAAALERRTRPARRAGMDSDLLDQAPHRRSRRAEALRRLLDEERLPHSHRRVSGRALCKPGDAGNDADHRDPHQLLVTSHENGARLQRGRSAELSGWAWDGGSGISTVEFSVDEGQSWRPATLDKDLGRFAWRGFRFALDTASAGSRSVAVRAASRAGARQPDKLTPNPSGYHHNIVQRLTLEVA